MRWHGEKGYSSNEAAQYTNALSVPGVLKTRSRIRHWGKMSPSKGSGLTRLSLSREYSLGHLLCTPVDSLPGSNDLRDGRSRFIGFSRAQALRDGLDETLEGG